MKTVLDWIKGHVAVVALAAIILVSLPSAFAVSSVLNRGLRKSREAEVNKDLKDIDAAPVTYTLPPVTPGGEAITHRAAAPNETITRWFREQRQARDAQVGEVVKIAAEINSAGHEMLLQGLFPKPPDADSVFKRMEFVDLLSGREDVPSVYQRLFDSVHAGPPADPVRIAEELAEVSDREKERIKAEFGKDEMTPEQKDEMIRKLVGQRLGRYQQRAKEISFYATMDCLGPHPNPPRRAFTDVDRDAALWQCFEWQWDYWVTADILRAIAEANSANGRWMPLEQSVVKRVERIRIDRLPVGGGENSEETAMAAGPGQAPLDPNYSITGRRTSKANTLYDVRPMDLEVIVDSSRVIDLINAISRTSFMTVIGCELRTADPRSDLGEGYYYGDDHVMRAKLRIETVWLRSWTVPLMPPELRQALGIEPAPEGTAAPEVAAVAPPPPVRREPAGDDETTARPKRRGGGEGGGGG